MPSIDEKVVKISLDESDLNKETKKAVKDLDDLKQALLFKDAEKGLEAVTSAAAKVDMSPLSKGIGDVTNQFNLLNTIGAATIFNITNRVIDSGEKLIKSLSVDQINAGWSKFADKTSAVQTIMSATSNQFNDTGKQMEYVESELEKLNWFTDETSYRFLDMVNNIGKFTSGNIALDDSVNAMQGIATWAARSGAGVEGASRAMYNLSQSMAMGALRLEDWMSIENANMATYEFKETALDTAVSLGTLIKQADGLYQTIDGSIVTIESFRETLQEKWLTSDVLIKTLDTYGAFATKLNEFYEELEGNVPTTTLIGFIDDYISGTFDMSEAMRLTGKDAEWLNERISKLASSEYKLGRESFKAAQETKTFQEAIDYVRESVSSGWMRTFEYLFGNYQEAKEFFSSMSEWLYDIFVASGDARNALLALWKDEGGRDIFIDGLYQIMDIISSLLETIKEAWEEVFPPTTADDLLNITEGFKYFVDILTPTEDVLNTISKLVQMVATSIQTLTRIVKNGAKAFYPYFLILNRLSGISMNLLGSLAELSVRLMNLIFPSDGLNKFGEGLLKTNSVISNIMDGGIDILVELLGHLLHSIDVFFTYIETHGGGVSGILAGLSLAFDELADGLINMEGVQTILGGMFGGVGAIFKGITATIQQVIGEIFGIDFEEGTGITGWLNGISDNMDDLNIPEKLEKIVLGIGNVAGALLQFAADLLGVDTDIRETINGLVIDLVGVFHWLVEQVQNLTIEDVKNIGLVVILGYIAKAFRDLLYGLKSGVGELTKIFKQIRGLLDTAADDSISQRLSEVFGKTKWLQIGIAIGLLVTGLLQLSRVPAEDLYKGVIAIISVLGMLMITMKIIQKITEGMPKRTMDQFIAIMAAFGAAVGLIGFAVAEIAKIENGFAVAGALGAIGSLLIMLVVFSEKVATMDISKISKAAGSISLLAISITAMTAPVFILGNMPIQALSKGIIAVGSLLLTFGTFGALLQKVDWKPILSSVPVMMAFTGALVVLDAVIGSMMLMLVSNADGFKTAIDSLSTLIILFGLMTSLMGVASSQGNSQTLAMLAVDMLAFSAAMVVLANSIKMLGEMNPQQIQQGLLAVAGGILALTAGLSTLMLVANVTVGAIPVFTSLSSVLLSVAASIAAIGVAAAGIGVSVYLLVTSFNILLEAGREFGDELPIFMNKAMDGVEVAILRLLEIIASAATPILSVALVVFGSIVNALKLTIPDIIEGIMLLVTEILKVIGELADPLMKALIDLIENITKNIEPLFQAIDQFLEILIYRVALTIRRLLTDLSGFIYTIITGNDFRGVIGDAVSTSVKDSLVGGTEKGTETAKESIEKNMKSSGENAAEAFADGVEETSDDVLPGIGSRMVDMLASGSDSNIDAADAAGRKVGNAYGSAVADSAQSWMARINSSGLFDLSKKIKDEDAKDDTKANTSEELKEWMEDTDVKSSAEEAGFASGNSYGTGFGKGLSSSSAPSAGARAQAKKIDDAFSDEMKKLDTSDKTAEALLNLWKAQNPNATDAEIAIKEMELLASRIETQSARVRISQMQYSETLEKMGDSASETHEAYLEMIEDQTKLLELQNEMSTTQIQSHEATAEAFQRMNEILHDYYYNSINGQTMADYLKSLGFTDREIAESAAKEAGYAIPTIVEDTKEAAVDAATTAGQQTVQLYTESVKSNLQSVTPVFMNFGNDYATSLGTGMTDKTEDVGNAALSVVTGAQDTISSEDVTSKWVDIGYQINMGIIKGLENGEGELYSTIRRIIRRALQIAETVAGVASPSKETEWQSSMWIEGYTRGLKKNGDNIAKSLGRFVQKSFDDGNSIEKYGENSGNVLGKGIINGIDRFSKSIGSSKKFVDRLLSYKTPDNNLQTYIRDLQEQSGLLDDSEIRINVVMAWSSTGDVPNEDFLSESPKQIKKENKYYADRFDMVSKEQEDRLNSLADRFDKSRKVSDIVKTNEIDDTINPTTINMTQNNYSPKALTRLEIRRDTETLTTQMANKLNSPKLKYIKK